MTRLPGVAAELALAFRAVSAAFNRLPPDRRPAGVGRWGHLEAEIDEACAIGDRDRAIAAISDWKRDQLRRIREAA